MISVCPKYAICAYPWALETSVWYLYTQNIQYVHILGPLIRAYDMLEISTADPTLPFILQCLSRFADILQIP